MGKGHTRAPLLRQIFAFSTLCRVIPGWRRAKLCALEFPHSCCDLLPSSTFPLPFGGEGGPLPALSPVGAGRVRGSPASAGQFGVHISSFSFHGVHPLTPGPSPPRGRGRECRKASVLQGMGIDFEVGLQSLKLKINFPNRVSRQIGVFSARDCGFKHSAFFHDIRPYARNLLRRADH